MVQDDRMGLPPGKMLNGLFKESDAVVGRRIVDEDELHFVQGLVKQALGAPYDIVFDFVYGNDYGYFVHRLKNA